MGSKVTYGLLDGVFQQALLGHLCGRGDALDELVSEVRALLPLMARATAA